VWARSSDTNTTVYCGGINNLSDDVVRATFGIYGQITGIHPFPDRGYSFVRFATKEAACNAICGVHGMEVNGGIMSNNLSNAKKNLPNKNRITKDFRI